jgi:hypothetical protein
LPEKQKLKLPLHIDSALKRVLFSTHLLNPIARQRVYTIVPS